MTFTSFLTGSVELSLRIGVIWLITLVGGGGKFEHGSQGLIFTKESSSIKEEVFNQSLINICTVFRHSYHPFLSAPLQLCSQKKYLGRKNTGGVFASP